MVRHEPSGRAGGPRAADAVREVLGPVAERLGLLVEDVVVTPVGARRLLRVVLDVADDEPAAGLSLDMVAEASREISVALDSTDVMQGAYVLEVTSPGVDRPLTQPGHFRRNLRRLVSVQLADGGQVTGRVRAADDHLALTVAGPKKGMSATRELAWPEVVRGQVQVEFNAFDDESGA